tara:strand:- start:8573 stop:9937 length:1365 start_codon:yes stop_codon:yes gene_type:complete
MSLCPPTLEGNGNFESCATELSSACYTSVTCANWLVTGVIDYNEYQYDGGESYGPKVFNPQTCAGNQEIIDPSPQGGMYAGAEAGGGEFYIWDEGEEFETTINGLVVGEEYVLGFYQANGHVTTTGNEDYMAWRVTIGNNTPIYAEIIAAHESSNWSYQTLLFTADNTSMTLNFEARTDINTNYTFDHSTKYILLDGVNVSHSLSEGTIIGPEIITCDDPVELFFDHPTPINNTNYQWDIYDMSGSLITYYNGQSILLDNLESGSYTVEITVNPPGSCPSTHISEIQVICCEICPNCNSFKLMPKEKYVLNAWVKEGHAAQQTSYDNSFIELSYNGSSQIDVCATRGEIIEGWQQIYGEFVVPLNATNINISLINNNTDVACYFDDIRIHPYNSNLKSFVYDQKTQKLMAELDENNYATFYEYDSEGGLIRVKKETERGVYTIQETRSGTQKSE